MLSPTSPIFLHVLPVEVWLAIFALACTDGGQTGCALSAVSRRTHLLAAGHRFQSVAVASVARLYMLVDTLCALPPLQGAVRHLYLRRFFVDAAEELIHPASGHTVCHVLRAFVAHAAPTLETLCLVYDGPRLCSAASGPPNASLTDTVLEIITKKMDGVLAGLHFPQLTDLSLFGDVALPVHAPAFAPRLQRLYAPWDTLAACTFAQSAAAAFPRLTHVRVARKPRLGYDATHVLADLALALGLSVPPQFVSDDARTEDKRRVHAPCFLLVEHGQSAAACRRGSACKDAKTEVTFPRRFAEHSPYFILLSPARERGGVPAAETIEALWRKGIGGGGGGGFWSVSPYVDCTPVITSYDTDPAVH